VADITTLSEHACFGGVQSFHEHASTSIGLPMRFGVYRPPQAAHGRVPVLVYLAGLTCNEETFPIKAGAQRFAAEHGLMLVTPDTSPRRTGIAGAADDWDFGEGAGFYLDATQAPWSRHFRMESYVTQELHALVLREFPALPDRVGLFGHSMGGHGALTLALRHPGQYRSVSALAPVCAPMRCPWGRKAFSRYLGEDETAWAAHDATELIKSGARAPALLVDQGLGDKFLAEQLHPHLLEEAARGNTQPLALQRREGYDHGYYFVASMMAGHIAHHARQLTAGN
jgi:S-formylglutathione hydrolase